MGSELVTGFHLLALFVIGGSIVWSAVARYIAITQKVHAGLDDALLLSMQVIGVVAGAILMLSIAALTLELADNRLSEGEADD